MEIDREGGVVLRAAQGLRDTAGVPKKKHCRLGRD